MFHEWSLDTKFFDDLAEIDAACAEGVRAAACRPCGGPLDCGDYPRKARGLVVESAAGYERRTSFCCRRCRKRTTPPSLRFLGRKVYVAAIVVVACEVLSRLVGRGVPVGSTVGTVPVRTVRRWQGFWRTTFASGAFFAAARGLLAPPVEEDRLPDSLLKRFEGPATKALTRFLAFVSPITTSSCEARRAMAV